MTVNVAAECQWSASSGMPWVAITSGGQGQGSGSVTFRVASNPDPTPRAGAVLVNDGRVDVTQQAAACRFDVGRVDSQVGSAGLTAQLQIRTHDLCAWSAASDVSWATIAPGSGRGNATLTLNVSANPGESRSGGVLVAGERMTLTQSAVTAPPPPAHRAAGTDANADSAASGTTHAGASDSGASDPGASDPNAAGPADADTAAPAPAERGSGAQWPRLRRRRAMPEPAIRRFRHARED